MNNMGKCYNYTQSLLLTKLLFQIWPHLGPFYNFWPIGAFFGLRSGSKLTTFILEVWLYLASLKLSRGGGWTL